MSLISKSISVESFIFNTVEVRIFSDDGNQTAEAIVVDDADDEQTAVTDNESVQTGLSYVSHNERFEIAFRSSSSSLTSLDSDNSQQDERPRSLDFKLEDDEVPDINEPLGVRLQILEVALTVCRLLTFSDSDVAHILVTCFERVMPKDSVMDVHNQHKKLS